MADRYIYDYGQTLQITVETVDYDTADTVTILFRKPSGAELLRTADSHVVNVVTYAFVAGDLDEAGTWRGQVIGTFPTSVQTTDPFAFVVGARI